MLNDEVICLKEELDCLRAKCEALHKELHDAQKRNEKLSYDLKASELQLQAVQQSNQFLSGQVEAFKFVFSNID